MRDSARISLISLVFRSDSLWLVFVAVLPRARDYHALKNKTNSEINASLSFYFFVVVKSARETTVKNKEVNGSEAAGSDPGLYLTCSAQVNVSR